MGAMITEVSCETNDLGASMLIPERSRDVGISNDQQTLAQSGVKAKSWICAFDGLGSSESGEVWAHRRWQRRVY